jgi:glutamate racemase
LTAVGTFLHDARAGGDAAAESRAFWYAGPRKAMTGSGAALQPIGVFDSGLGGLTVASALERVLPDEQIIYLGDTARVPYGTKSAETVIRYALQVGRFLLRYRVKYLVVACNTASAHAIGALRQRLPVPLMGVVEPGAALAAQRSQTGALGVLGTLGTVASRAYEVAVQRRRPELAVFSQACPLLVPLAEEGWLAHPVTHQVVRHYLLELRSQMGDIDTLVLGCTHYPLLKDTIAAQAHDVFAREISLVDSAEAVANAVAADLAARSLASDVRPGEDRFFFSDVNRFAEVAARFLGRAIPVPEHADL